MRARLARALRRAANRLAGGMHHLSVRNAGTVSVYIDGREVEVALNRHRRERGLPGI